MSDSELLTALAIQEDVLYTASQGRKEILEEVRARKNRLVEQNRLSNQASKNNYKTEE